MVQQKFPLLLLSFVTLAHGAVLLLSTRAGSFSDERMGRRGSPLALNVSPLLGRAEISQASLPKFLPPRLKKSPTSTTFQSTETSHSTQNTLIPSSGQRSSSPSQASVFGEGGSGGRASLRSLYIAELRAQIDAQKIYPTAAKRLGQVGEVEVSFTVMDDGAIVNERISRESPYERLNHSALQTVKHVGKVKPIPEELGVKSLKVEVPISFSLL